MYRTLCCAVMVLAAEVARADDWPGWRGPDRTGVSKETGLLKEWPEGGPKLAWKATGLGGGYALGFDVGGWVPGSFTGARGFWLANTASLLIAGIGLAIYLRTISARSVRMRAVKQADSAA